MGLGLSYDFVFVSGCTHFSLAHPRTFHLFVYFDGQKFKLKLIFACFTFVFLA